MAEKFLEMVKSSSVTFIKHYKARQMPKKIPNRHRKLRLMKIKDKEKLMYLQLEKNEPTFNGTTIRTSAISQHHDAFVGLKGNTSQSGIPYLAKNIQK